MYGARSFTPDEYVLEVKPQNRYMFCGENEEKMMFLTSSNQAEKCCKGQQSSSFFSFVFFVFRSTVALLQVNEIW